MYYEFNVNERIYKLRLTTMGVTRLEQTLGCNPVQVLWNIDDNNVPKISDIAAILHQMLQSYEHGITIDNTYRIIDDYIESGYTYWDLIEHVIEGLKASGFLQSDDEADNNTQKN